MKSYTRLSFRFCIWILSWTITFFYLYAQIYFGHLLFNYFFSLFLPSYIVENILFGFLCVYTMVLFYVLVEAPPYEYIIRLIEQNMFYSPNMLRKPEGGTVTGIKLSDGPKTWVECNSCRQFYRDRDMWTMSEWENKKPARILRLCDKCYTYYMKD